MADKNTFLEATAQSFSDTLHRVIGNTFIVEYGIVKAIPAEGVVTVEMSVAEKASEIIITDCVLASLASSSFSVRIEPNIDDKVIVLFPRKFNNDMFQQDENEPIIKDASTGYNVLSGIAILLNQYQENTHKNFLDISNGVLTLKLAYSENDDKNLFTFTTDENGGFVLSNNKADISLDKDGVFVLSNNKAGISLDKDGAYSVSNDKYSLDINKDGEVTVSMNNASLNVNKQSEVTFKADKIELLTNKDNEITVKNGKATIKIDKDGTVSVESDKDVTVKATNITAKCTKFTVADNLTGETKALEVTP